MAERLFFDRPAEYWEEAVPLGNGSLGAMVYGDPVWEKIPLNHDTLWSGHPVRESRPGAREAFERARSLALAGDCAGAEREIDTGFLSNWTQCYLPLGDLLLDFPKGEYTDYARSLSLDEGTAACAYTMDGVRFRREAFCSHPDDLFVLRLTADRPGRISCRVRLASELRPISGSGADVLWIDGECPYDYARHMDHLPGGQAMYYSADPEKHGVRFRFAVRVLTEGGRVSYDDYSAVLEGCDGAVILGAVSTSFIDFDHRPDAEYRESCLRKLDRVTDGEDGQRVSGLYERLRQAHVRDHGALYGRVSFRLDGPSCDELPTFERLLRHRDGGEDAGLYSLLFQYGRYLTIAASRPGSQAMNLQGIWNPHLHAPWNSNYTVNINTEMNYWPTLPANLEECHRPMLDLIRAVSVTGRDTARSFYGAPGWVCHHNTDLWAHTVPVRVTSTWAFWHGGSGWLCRSGWEHWLYTGDRDFLREFYPILRGAAEFYDAILAENRDGRLVLSPATSPENTFLLDGKPVSTAEWTACSQAIAAELFQNVIAAAEELGVDSAFSEKLRADLARFPDFRIGSRGQLLEWNEEYEESEPTHRHTSHLFGLHPGRLFTSEKTRLREAARRSLELRGDDGTGWSLGWKINHWARLRDGDHALRLIDMQLRPVDPNPAVNCRRGGTYPNLFDAHPPFQIDGNFGYTSGVCEMLLQWEPGRLHLLPALPKAWRSGAVSGLRAPGGLEVGMSWQDGELTGLDIRGDVSGLRMTLFGRDFVYNQ